MTDIEVTEFIRQECMRDYSASVAEIGADAGVATWSASVEAVTDWNFLPSADMLQEFREWLKPWGAWDDDEINAMSDDHLRALCLQWIASDWRECFDWKSPDDTWEAYEQRAQDGISPSSFWRDDTGRVFWSMSH